MKQRKHMRRSHVEHNHMIKHELATGTERRFKQRTVWSLGWAQRSPGEWMMCGEVCLKHTCLNVWWIECERWMRAEGKRTLDEVLIWNVWPDIRSEEDREKRNLSSRQMIVLASYQLAIQFQAWKYQSEGHLSSNNHHKLSTFNIQSITTTIKGKKHTFCHYYSSCSALNNSCFISISDYLLHSNSIFFVSTAKKY